MRVLSLSSPSLTCVRLSVVRCQAPGGGGVEEEMKRAQGECQALSAEIQRLKDDNSRLRVGLQFFLLNCWLGTGKNKKVCAFSMDYLISMVFLHTRKKLNSICYSMYECFSVCIFVLFFVRSTVHRCKIVGLFAGWRNSFAQGRHNRPDKCWHGAVGDRRGAVFCRPIDDCNATDCLPSGYARPWPHHRQVPAVVSAVAVLWRSLAWRALFSVLKE